MKKAGGCRRKKKVPDMENQNQQKETGILDQSIETPYLPQCPAEEKEEPADDPAREEETGAEKGLKRERKIPEGVSRGASALKAAANAVVLLLNGIVIALIVYLFLAQPESGERIRPTIQKFSVNSDQYYSEHETYQQINANVHVYQSEGRPD